jgi:hypothetical protein
MKTVMIGKKFGRLLVAAENPIRASNKGKRYDCACDCGGKSISAGIALRRGDTKSCGCLRKENALKAVTKHGKYLHPLYSVWSRVKARGTGMGSLLEKKYYRDKGIGICSEWLDFKAFYEWARPRWKKGLEIDRIDTLGDYSPRNCRFVTHKENQQNSRRSKIWVVYGKQFKSSADAAKFIKMSMAHVCRICEGWRTPQGKYRPPEQFCYSVKRYPNAN